MVGQLSVIKIDTSDTGADPGKLPQSSVRRSEVRVKIIIIHYSTVINLSELVNILVRKNPRRLKMLDILNSA